VPWLVLFTAGDLEAGGLELWDTGVVPHYDVVHAELGELVLYRLCRSEGETVRALTACLIAVVALRTSVAVLHSDRDFDVLARHTGLRAARGGQSR
jgi:predicted nucleic acid-binding protein